MPTHNPKKNLPVLAFLCFVLFFCVFYLFLTVPFVPFAHLSLRSLLRSRDNWTIKKKLNMEHTTSTPSPAANASSAFENNYGINTIEPRLLQVVALKKFAREIMKTTRDDWGKFGLLAKKIVEDQAHTNAAINEWVEKCSILFHQTKSCYHRVDKQQQALALGTRPSSPANRKLSFDLYTMAQELFNLQMQFRICVQSLCYMYASNRCGFSEDLFRSAMHLQEQLLVARCRGGKPMLTCGENSV